MSKSECQVLEAIAEKGPCSKWDLAGSASGRQKDGHTSLSYTLVHRLLQRLLKSGLVIRVGKWRRTRGRPVTKPSGLELSNRRRSTVLFGLTFRGYVEFAAFCRSKALPAAEGHSQYLRFTLFDYLPVFQRWLGDELLTTGLWWSALSALSIAREHAGSIFNLKRLERKPEYRSLSHRVKESLERYPTEQDYEWELEETGKTRYSVRFRAIEHSQETRAKQQFAVSFFLSLNDSLSSLRMSTSEMRRTLQDILRGNEGLHSLLVETFSKERARYQRLNYTEERLRVLFRP